MQKVLTIMTAMLVAYGSLLAQENKHSIEITTGYPSLVSMFEYPNSVNESFDGRSVDEHFQPGLNIGYVYSFAKRWEVNPMLHFHLTSYDLKQYPEINDASAGNGVSYDWDADPTSVDKIRKIYGSINVSFRFKWLLRESFSMYSALGLGFTHGLYFNEFPCPIPYFAPFGIKFGKGNVYGIAEINVSAATTFGMLGLGIRL